MLMALKKQPKNLEAFLNDVEFALKEGFLKDVGQDTSPTAGQEMCSSAGQDTSTTASQEVCSSAGQDKSPIASQEVCSSACQDTSPTASPEVFPSTGQDTSPTASEEVCSSAGQDSSPTASQEVCSSACQDTSPTAGQEMCSSAGQDTSTTASQEVCSSAGQDKSPIASQEVCSSACQDTSPTASPEVFPSTGQDTSPTASEEVCSSAGQDSSPTASQEVCSSACQDTSPTASQEVCSSAGQDKSTTASQEVRSSICQDTSPTASQEVCSSTCQDTSSTASQEVCSSADQDSSPTASKELCSSVGQDTSPTASQEVCSSVGQDTSPTASQEVCSLACQDSSPIASQEVWPSAGQDTSPTASHKVCSIAYQDASPTASQEVWSSAGQDTSPTASHKVCSIAYQDASPTASQEVWSSVGQDTSHTASQEVCSSAGQDKSPTASQEVCSSACQDTSPTASQAVFSSACQDSSATASQEVWPSACQDASLTVSQELCSSVGQDISPTASQEVCSSVGQDTSPTASQEVWPSAGQDSSPTASQEVFSSAGQDTSPTASQEVWPAAGQDTSPSASQVVWPSAGQDISPTASREVCSSTGQDTSHTAGQEVWPSACQETSPTASQELRSSAGQDGDNYFQNIPFVAETSFIEDIVYSSDPLEMFDDNENDNMIDIIDLMCNFIPHENENDVPHIEHANELEAGETEVENEAVGSEDEEMNENNDPSEDEKLRDKNNPEIYVIKVLKSALHKTKQNKKKDRVYNSKHACFFCGKLVLHVRVHIISKHKKEHLVETALKDKTGIAMSLLRSKGDDKHNNKVVAEGHGCLLISRRPTKELDSEQYGPCVHCREWMLKSTLKRHQSKCIAQRVVDVSPLTKRNLILQSDILSGRLQTKASSLLQKEVFAIMNTDKVTEIAQKDLLIVALGESWLRRNIDNKLKRKYYASQRMRLTARFLIALLEEDTASDAKSLWEFLVPQKFDCLAKAAITVAMPTMEDEEELKSPSNAIKLKYDVIRLVNAKWCITLKEENDLNNGTINDCQGLMKLIQTEWPEKVTRFARMVLAQRQREVKQHIPAPGDIKLLNEHLTAELKTAPLRKELPDFSRAVKLAQTKLQVYNKRRSGEIDAVSLRDYAKRSQHLNDVDQSLVGELTELEKHLLTSQQLMTLRGKRNRPVPCIIPMDAIRCLSFISNAEVRAAVGIAKNNTYLFASTGQYNVRSYDSLKAICGELSLSHPDRITSVNLRKYTATLSQVINLQPNELQWLCSHLGHTTRVHLDHYRQMSGFIERVKISKVLLMQDMNLTEKFVGKSLDEIGSIPFEDLLTSGPETCGDEIGAESQAEVDAEDTSLETPEGYGSMDEDDHTISDEDEEEFEGKRKRKPTKKAAKRQKFTEVETEEIKTYFSEYLQSGICPRKQQVENAKQKSRKKNGQIWKRSNDKIIKKISAMNHKKN